MGKKYRLEILEDGKWYMQGTYPEKSVPQMAQAVAKLTAKGFKMHDTMRMLEVMPDGKTNIL